MAAAPNSRRKSLTPCAELLPMFMEQATNTRTTVLAELRSRNPKDTESIEATLFPSESPKLDMFAGAMQAFLETYGFLGLSLDVYNPSSKLDSSNHYMQMIKGLKPGLSQHKYLLAANVYFTKGFNDGLDYKELVKNVDILIMGTHNLIKDDKITAFPSPLYGPKPSDISWVRPNNCHPRAAI
nr:uncharacterized protein LOC126544956 [Dermacentor andersoni]